MKISASRLTLFIAGFLLAIMLFMAFFSLKNDSLTMDELAHLPAGYSYLTQKDMRLNPEHPPLIKDLAALPLLFIKDIKFPSGIKAWQEDINGQWDFGRYFLYQAGNPTEKIIFWGRIPMLLILLILGIYVFRWSRQLYGNKAALLALFLFSFSPTFLAHGRLVTTDVGAAAGVFIALYYFIKNLKNPTAKNIILAGVFFGIAQLLKFSVIFLVPLFIFLAFVYWRKNWKKILKILFLVFVIGYALVGVVYQYHVWDYPPQKQADDARFYLEDYPSFIKNPLIFAAEKPILRPYSQYLTGLFMVFHRASFGNTTYFMGEVSNLGWKHYFSTVYFIKETLVFHILSLAALFFAVRRLKKPSFPVFAMFSFLGLYWLASLTSNLNIGVRHLLPVFPFMIVLISPMANKLKSIILILLVLWQTFSVVSVYPSFLAYFNEVVGGPDKGYLYTVDSNLDWGQDLKRLAKWIDENNIEKVKIAYFGGSDPKYYLGEKAEYFSWEEPQSGWIAVSATFLQGGLGKPAPGFNQPTGYFNWLKPYSPVAKIGYSIFVYHIE